MGSLMISRKCKQLFSPSHSSSPKYNKSIGGTSSQQLIDDDYRRRHKHMCEGSAAMTKKGYVPVVVVGSEQQQQEEEDGGGGGGGGKRYLIHTQLMAHPSILSLLDLSADEFGYAQDGVIRIPCEPSCFRRIVAAMPSCKRKKIISS